jgi:hypothetical protein
MSKVLNRINTQPGYVRVAAKWISYRDAKKLARILRVKIAASSHVTDRIQSSNVRAMSRYELQPIRSLCSSVSCVQGLPLSTVERITAAYFGVKFVADIPKEKYAEVIRFLVDVRLDKFLQDQNIGVAYFRFGKNAGC